MSGAYVAKIGLNYSLVVELGATSFLAGEEIAVAASFRLNGTSRTREPADTTITWTATIGGVAVNLRILSVGSYGASATSEVWDNGTYWYTLTNLEFEDIGAAVDQTIVITATGSIEGVDVTDNKSATIPDYSLVVTGPASIDNYLAAAACVASFRADSTDLTAEPINKTITWSATIDATPVNLRVGSSGSYTSTATDTVANSGSFWEASSSLEFNPPVAYTDRTLIVTGAGVIEGLAVNDTASMTIPGWPDINYTYSIDLEDVFWVGGPYHWEFRGSIAVRKRSDDSVVYFLRKYVRQIRAQDGGAIEQGIVAETNPENNPGDITFSISATASDFGDPPNYYEDNVSGTINITVDEQDPLMYYVCLGESYGARTSTGTNTVAHTMDLTSVLGVIIDTDMQSDTYIQASSTGSLKAQGTTITRLTWSP